MAAATGGMNNVTCNIPESEQDSEKVQQQQEPSSQFSDLPTNIFGSRDPSFSGRSIGNIGYSIFKSSNFIFIALYRHKINIYWSFITIRSL